MIHLPDTIKMVITDFDGIVTDNCVYIDDNGIISRKLNFKDIMGFSLLKKNGFMLGIISGEKNKSIDILADKFNIEEVHQNIRKKMDVLNLIKQKYKLTENEYVYIGDDVNDFDLLLNSKYAITVPSAINKIKELPHIQITENKAGDGAFREIADSLL